MPDHSKTTIVARINKAGTHVICGRPVGGGYCGFRLAEAVINQGSVRVLMTNKPGPLRRVEYMTTFDRATEPPDLPDLAYRCYIVFGPGWRFDPDGRIWQLTNHARTRYDASRQIAASNAPSLSTRERGRHQKRLKSRGWMSWAHRSPVDERSGVGHSHHPEHRTDFPAYAQCPDCDGVNRLEAELRDEAIARYKSRQYAQSPQRLTPPRS